MSTVGFDVTFLLVEGLGVDIDSVLDESLSKVDVDVLDIFKKKLRRNNPLNQEPRLKILMLH